MPAKSPSVTKALERSLRHMGERLRDRRKALGVSAVAAAESAGMSRITLYRIERGEISVTMGAYMSLIAALGLHIDLSDGQDTKKKKKSPYSGKLPKTIRLADFKELKRLGWQLKAGTELSPKEALDLYERNWRHLDLKKMDAKEKRLLKSLLQAFGRERLLV